MNKSLFIFICSIGIFGGLGIYYLKTEKSLHQKQIDTIQNNDTQFISFLQEYIRIPTAQPNPDYVAARAFLRARAQADGFTYQEIPLPSGLAALIISYEGTDKTLPSLLLNHHMDVVPADESDGWMSPPFAGEIRDNIIIGRGTQDMKGIGTVHYYALKTLKENGIRLRRSIHLLAVPDEERGGFKGTKELVTTDAFKKLNVGYVLDEGSASGSSDMLYIKIAERKPMQIRVTATGTAAHGSKLLCTNANHALIKFLDCIVTEHQKQQQKTNFYAPGQLLSMNITTLNAGFIKDGTPILNVVPACAQATIDIRVPPTMTMKNAQQFFDAIINKFPQISYTIQAMADDYESPPHQQETALYIALEQCLKKHELQALPLYFEGASDVRFYHALGIQGLGFTPFTSVDNIHGVNESVTIDELLKARDILITFLKDFCT